MNHKSLKFQLKDFDEEQGIFTGHAAVFGNVDSGGDIIEPGAFSKTLEKGWGRVKILALHNDAWLPIGRPTKLEEDDIGLYIEGKISDTSMGRDVKVLLRDKVLNEMSIGYDPIVFDFDEKSLRHLREVDLLEISLVTWAMNDQALVSDYKSLSRAATVMAQEAARESKEGRKISAGRLKTLEEASRVLKEATKALDSIISDARSNTAGKAISRPAKRPEKFYFYF